MFSLNKKRFLKNKKQPSRNLAIYLYLLTLLLIVLAIGYTAWFLYYNFYQTLGHEQQILLLRKEVALDMVDTELYNEAKQRSGEKLILKKFTENELKNYFIPY